MEEQLITFETAKLAKKKGFNENIAHLYLNNGESDYDYDWLRKNSNLNSAFDDGAICTAPTQSLLQKWLRETHNIDVEVIRDSEVHYRDETRWIVKTLNWNDIKIKDFPIAQLKFPDTSHHTDFKSYEEALEKGLEEALKFIQNERI